MRSSEFITELNCQYGEYYCSTDKKVKCRKSPKKSRTNENLRDWFGKGKKGGAGGGGWDR